MGDAHHDATLGHLPGRQIQRSEDSNCCVKIDQGSGNKGKSGRARETEQAHNRCTPSPETINQTIGFAHIHNDIERQYKLDHFENSRKTFNHSATDTLHDWRYLFFLSYFHILLTLKCS